MRWFRAFACFVAFRCWGVSAFPRTRFRKKRGPPKQRFPTLCGGAVVSRVCPFCRLPVFWGGGDPLSVNFWNPLVGGPRHPRRWLPICAVVACVCPFCRFPVLGGPAFPRARFQKEKMGPARASVANAVWRFSACAILYFWRLSFRTHPRHNGTLSGWLFR